MARRKLSDPLPAKPADHGPCPICGRTVLSGSSANRHHWLPKAKGGREWSWIHRVCHRKIHSLWAEAELARNYASPDAVRADPEMARFVEWVRGKHPEFYDSSITSARKKRR